jgi:hypothetical protein
VWGIDFPGGISNDNVKWRAFIWAISEAILVVSVAINYLPPKMYSAVFRLSVGLLMLDFFLCVIWLPIGVSKTYGFRSAKDVFTMTCERLLLSHRNEIKDGGLLQIMAPVHRLAGTGSYPCESFRSPPRTTSDI